MVILTALVALASVVASVALLVFGYRRNRRNQLRTELARQCFAGQPQAVVHLATWELPEADIRQMAGQCGYAETQPPDPSVLVFHPVQGNPGTSDVTSSRALRRLSKRLASADFVWVDIADTGGTPADITALAHQHGARILRTYGDRAQPVLLLGKRPINSVRDVVAGKRGLRSWTAHWLAGGVMVVAMVLIGVVTVAAQNGLGWLTWPVVGLAALALLAGFGINVVPPFRDATTRMNRLIHEFDGRVQLTIIAQHYRFSMPTYLDVAAELGYQEANSLRDWTTTSRWNRSWLRFIRR